MTAAEDFVQAGGLAAAFVNMDENEAAALLADRYQLSGSLTRLATEKDDTFRVACGNGRRYILKCANPAEDVAEIELQLDLLRHIAPERSGLPVPRVIPTVRDETHFMYRDRAGQQRDIRLLSYLEGTILSETSCTADEREKIGKALAALRLAMAVFSHPAAGRDLAWDVRHLLRLEHLVDAIDDREGRNKLQAGLDRFAAFSDRIDACRCQVLHNDFSKSNIVVNHGSEDFVTGIIDFGDIVHTAIAVDVSTALLNQLPSQNLDDLFKDGRDVLRGYLTVADLTEEEVELIPHLVMGRVIARTLLTTWRAKLFPDNATYITRNTPQGWPQLDWFLQRSADEVSATLLSECGAC
ncbi:phosphotransferase [Fodinicurvata sp. EGI_FJ10296]|uniref:phosphotransferase n=1 Tax=Fodinicurvata sp. EGI_FJ10296 TaxID=3231908 RepID=UPI003452402A